MPSLSHRGSLPQWGYVSHRNDRLNVGYWGEQGRHSGESAPPPPPTQCGPVLIPAQCHMYIIMWVEFSPSSEGFSPGFLVSPPPPLNKNQHFNIPIWPGYRSRVKSSWGWCSFLSKYGKFIVYCSHLLFCFTLISNICSFSQLRASIWSSRLGRRSLRSGSPIHYRLLRHRWRRSLQERWICGAWRPTSYGFVSSSFRPSENCSSSVDAFL